MAIERITAFAPADRYLYDQKACSYENGWLQIDTKQDASYFGTWTNPEKREIFTYCEGDTTLIRCGTDEEYKQALMELVDWNKERGFWIGIDAGLSPTREAMTSRFKSLGLVDLIH